MRITAFDAQGARELDASELAAALAAQDRPLWVDMIGPTDDDLRLMADVFRFHPLAIEDTHNQQQRPKIEQYEGHLFLILNTIRAGEDDIAFQELDVFVGDHYLVTVHAAAEPVVDEARRRLGHAGTTLSSSVNHLLYVLLDTVVDSYFPAIDAVEEQIESLGDRIMAQPDQEALNQLFLLKRHLIEIWHALWPQREVVNSLAHYRPAFVNQTDLQYHLRDVADHLMWIADMVTTLRDTLTSMMDLYMSVTSNRLNAVVNRLTVFTVVIGVLTVISGFYGMNFVQSWPPFAEPWGVAFVLGLMVVAAGGLLGLLRYLRWY